MTLAVQSAPRQPVPLLAPAANPAAIPHLYLLTDLGTHVDGAPLLPTALNDHGDICASALTPGSEPALLRGFRLGHVSRFPVGVALGQPPATCISNLGHVAGTLGPTRHALRAWASHLGEFGTRLWPDSVSVARGVNSSGTVIGNLMVDAGAVVLSRAFLYPGAGSARPLTPPDGGTSIATGINDAGEIVFNAAPLGAPVGDMRAWLFRHGCYVAIAGLGGGRTWTAAITPQGRVVGHGTTVGGDTRAFLWEDGDVTDLGTLPSCMSQALAANDQRIVVGRVVDPLSGPRAFRWTPDTGLVLLEEHVAAPHGWRLREAVGINREGHIIGTGLLHGQPRGFLLKPAVF